ncbi:hypothetical protein CMT95_13015 [Elizabethkingia anophelis]|nr:hypothetical protein [Elizabethkingia anophelis]RBA34780.1 hypothetical protein DSC50_08830 [Elizabethkingia anophelis]CAH1149152.1 hypothetical protein EAVNVB490_03270 [Elizabethkingia anophelis]CAI9672168.1 hypothetical protein EAVNNN508_03266 [Elizabethkingia anophelis]CAI9674017.1 hypothetical protein EAVNVB490_01392 [Elizabethkingia anophelis]
MRRELTGIWYIKRMPRRKLFGIIKYTDFKIMVEVFTNENIFFPLPRTYTKFEEATPGDIIALEINIV